jgi:dTMP kinase
MLISIDGIDGCGKSTQVDLLAQALSAEQTIQISPSRWGKTLRALAAPTWEEQIALFLADRVGLVPRLEAAAGHESNHLVSDRSFLSGVAYQSFEASLSPTQLDAINRALVPEYDLQIYMNIPVTKAMERIESRGEAKTWNEKPALLTWAAQIFATWAEKHANIVMVDADQTIEEVHADVMAAARAASEKSFGRVVW